MADFLISVTISEKVVYKSKVLIVRPFTLSVGVVEGSQRKGRKVWKDHIHPSKKGIIKIWRNVSEGV
jgi:hypothetical protein